MFDRLTPAGRSALMASIKQGNTRPEIAVRKLLHRLGYRFRLHRRDLPGSPDVVLPKHHLAVFVHGCFWHRHTGCKRANSPKARADYWQAKFDRNTARDARNVSDLERAGWRVCVVWECQVRDEQLVRSLITDAIGE